MSECCNNFDNRKLLRKGGKEFLYCKICGVILRIVENGKLSPYRRGDNPQYLGDVGLDQVEVAALVVAPPKTAATMPRSINTAPEQMSLF